LGPFRKFGGRGSPPLSFAGKEESKTQDRPKFAKKGKPQQKPEKKKKGDLVKKNGQNQKGTGVSDKKGETTGWGDEKIAAGVKASTEWQRMEKKPPTAKGEDHLHTPKLRFKGEKKVL